MSVLVLIRGGGDLASGVALRLHRTGFQVLVTELSQPLVVRRSVAFADAVYRHEIRVEEAPARLATCKDVPALLAKGYVPVLSDPQAECRHTLQPDVIIDGRMTKLPPDIRKGAATLVIGLGPGFTAGVDCDAVIETMRGHFLGHVYWEGQALPDTGLPEAVSNHQADRVLRAPADGVLQTYFEIGDSVPEDAVVAEVGGEPVRARFTGMLRGLMKSGLTVRRGVKIGDLDPRMDVHLHEHVSDKAMAVGGAVLEAILSVPELRAKLCK